eukprot:7149566-Alexandrium_andersonii.AAC.1
MLQNAALPCNFCCGQRAIAGDHDAPVACRLDVVQRRGGVILERGGQQQEATELEVGLNLRPAS